MVEKEGDSRRFTDREVALVLKQASEIEEAQQSGPGRGLSLSDLEEIAREVGISPEAIAKAVDSLERERSVGPSVSGAPLVRRAVHAVSGELDDQTIARLVGLIDERVDTAGSVSEALGSVRWTGSERFRSTQVSITPHGGETTIQVVEKAPPRLRRVFHLLPAAWGLMLALPALRVAGSTGIGAAVGAAIGVAAGAAIGRFAWNRLSAGSDRRVKRLAAELSEEAANSAPAGALPSGGEE